MIKRRYCERWDAYYTKDRWLESTGCGKQKSCKKCSIKCFNRPDVPCIECSYESNCETKKEW